MGLFDWFKREKRSENGAEVSVNGDDVLLRSVIAGSRMDEQKAMSISAFAACVDFIADTAARLPVKLFRDCAEHCTAVLPVVESIQAALDRALLTESEKAQGLYFILDTSELLRGDMVSRFNAYSVALQNNIMSIDEVRYREDLPPLGFNYMKLGLADVLYDPKSGDIITPNMGTKIHTGDDENVLRDIIEERARHWTKGAHGYFTGSRSDGISGGSGVDKSVKNGIIEIEKSLSAAAKNYSVRLPESRNHAKLAENQAIHGKAFAGKGTKTEIKERFKLESLYQIPADEWKKMSGKGYVIVGGRKRYAELHWYESGNTIVDMKVKRYLDEG